MSSSVLPFVSGTINTVKMAPAAQMLENVQKHPDSPMDWMILSNVFVRRKAKAQLNVIDSPDADAVKIKKNPTLMHKTFFQTPRNHSGFTYQGF